MEEEGLLTVRQAPVEAPRQRRSIRPLRAAAPVATFSSLGPEVQQRLREKTRRLYVRISLLIFLSPSRTVSAAAFSSERSLHDDVEMG